MRTALLCALLILSGCASAWGAKLPGHEYGVLHGAVAIGAVAASDGITGNPWYGFVASCVGFAAHEWEESRGYSQPVTSAWDMWLDMIVPCGVGFGLSIKLK